VVRSPGRKTENFYEDGSFLDRFPELHVFFIQVENNLSSYFSIVASGPGLSNKKKRHIITAGMYSNNVKIYLIPTSDGDASKSLSFIAVQTDNIYFFNMWFSFFFFPFGV